MFDVKVLRAATLIGTALQVGMVVVGHFVPYVAAHVFMFGGMAISAIAGLIYGRAGKSYGAGALGGALAGGSCALIGIGGSIALGDTDVLIIVVGTTSSAVTGALGGLLGRAMLQRQTAST